MNSPFPYQTYAQDSNFYGRIDEIKKISSYLDNSENVLIYSKRRVGKSSLIKEIFRQKEKDFICIYVDIFDITSVKDFPKLLLKQIAQQQKGNIKTVTTKLKKLFSRISFSTTIDPSTGKISYSPQIADLNFDEAVEEVFFSLFELSKEKKIVLAIDEFQQVSLFKDTKIDALLRKYMQENKNISYIFLGSKRHLLQELFSYQSPLYEMAVHYDLPNIEVSYMYEYALQFLKLSEAQALYICQVSDYETKLIQHICNILYREFKSKVITNEFIDEALNEILQSKSSSYEVIFNSFTLPQKKAFKILTKYKQNIFKAEVLATYNIEKGNLSSALKQLFNKELIDKNAQNWFVPDRTFELWGKYRLN